MAADYLVSSLQPLTMDGPPPITVEEYRRLCREQLGENAFSKIEETWRDIDTQLRNAIATERARARGEDPAKWRRQARGCSLFWADRIAAAFQETDPAVRDRLLDRVRWDAAGELVPPSAPLSVAAAFAYLLRLEIAQRRSSMSTDGGNRAFDRLAAEAMPSE